MALVNVVNIVVLDNPTQFLNPFQFEISFECISALKEDLEWKIIYVGSAESEDYDQVLDSILVGPVPIGLNRFVFQADPPNTERIPDGDAVGVTVVLITCSYRGQEFIRVGYYVNNDYVDTELRENPPSRPDYTLMYRNILASKPRVTRIPIEWDPVETLESGLDGVELSSEALMMAATPSSSGIEETEGFPQASMMVGAEGVY
ncbi:anti-silencing protein 1 [Capsaspora owczarzaki ATCC 30864]|nr:anti-silencing protein 1 [Capsaspora owczarzaki ATCC 30864]|eukprot:XP_004364626.1 anti-silencing protein 1 [Capsaspora owczarzaki ATCC 30864]